MRQEFNDLNKYMHMEDRSDPKVWAWPGALMEAWDVPGADDYFMDFFGPGSTIETIAEAREENNVGTSILIDTMWTDEYRDAVEFLDVNAAPCAEDPDAPDVALRITQPKGYGKDKKLPVLILFHGAGYMFTAKMSDCEAAHYVKDLGCVVIAPEYRTYPENVFPAQLNDAHAAYQWVLDHGEEYGYDPERIVLTGNSFGALLSVVLAHRLKRYDVTPQPRGVVAIAPLCDDREIGTSGRICWATGGQPRPYAYHVCWEGYLGYGNAGLGALGPEAFPNHATVDEVRGLPPMCLHVNEHDVQRDASIQYAQKLYDAGVFCSLHVWGATKHGFTLSTELMTSDDPLFKRAATEILADIQGFFDHDFSR